LNEKCASQVQFISNENACQVQPISNKKCADKVQPTGISNGQCADKVQPISNEKCAGKVQLGRMKNGELRRTKGIMMAVPILGRSPKLILKTLASPKS
jgi:hypothetical protein